MKFEYGFESVNGIVKRKYFINQIPFIKDVCNVWGILPVCYIRQFTGLYDKNRTEVYEGDVLKYKHHLHRVYRVNGGLVINAHTDDFGKDNTPFFNACADAQTSHYIQQCEVIGNIHENNYEL